MKLHIVAILVILCLGVFIMHTATGSVSSDILRKSSCIELSAKKLNIRRLIGYKEQNVPIKAVMFITKTGNKICVKPDLKWVKDAMKFLDKKGVTRRPTTKSNPKPLTTTNKVSIKDC